MPYPNQLKEKSTMFTTPYPKIAVIIVNFNGKAHTTACLKAIEQQTLPPTTTIVVDNKSCEELHSEFLSRWVNYRYRSAMLPHTTSVRGNIIIENNSNVGFSGANNIGLRYASQDSTIQYFWIINNDTIPEATALEQLVKRAQRSPSLGVVGSTLIYMDPEATVQCFGGAKISSLLGTTSFIGEGRAAEDLRVAPESIEKLFDYITGASALISKECLAAVGLFPEEYFLYYEDVAWCLKAKRQGFRLGWAPQSVVMHHEGASSRTTSMRGIRRMVHRKKEIDYLMLRNRLWTIRTFFPYALPIAALSYLFVIANRIFRKDWDKIPIVWKALCHALQGKMGKPVSVFPDLL
jgi:hypothetical protein